jgi:hypothetical protein
MGTVGNLDKKRTIILRCSSLPMLTTCAPSVLNPEEWPRIRRETEAADVGTAVHAVCQKAVETGELNAELVIAQYPHEADRIRTLVNNFVAVWDNARTVITRPQCELELHATLIETPALTIRLTGHIDVCQIGTNESYILDYKTGRSHEVHYDQAVGYAYLLWDHAGRPDVYAVHIAVAYLEDNTIQNYTVSADDLKVWRAKIHGKVIDPQYVVGRKCGVCELNASCPTHKADLQYALDFLATDEAQKGKLSWVSMEPEERGALLDRLYVVRRGLERVELSLKLAMAGAHKKVQRLDIGNGMVYERVRTYRRRVDGATAYRVLSRRFDTSVLAQITEYKLEDILDLAAKYAPRNKKQQAREDLLNKLIQAGAVYTEEVERYQRRPANEKKLVPDTPAE